MMWGITSSVLVLLNSSLPGDPAPSVSRSLMSLKGDFLSVTRSRDSEGDLESLTVPSGLGSEYPESDPWSDLASSQHREPGSSSASSGSYVSSLEISSTEIFSMLDITDLDNLLEEEEDDGELAIESSERLISLLMLARGTVVLLMLITLGLCLISHTGYRECRDSAIWSATRDLEEDILTGLSVFTRDWVEPRREVQLLISIMSRTSSVSVTGTGLSQSSVPYSRPSLTAAVPDPRKPRMLSARSW